MQRDFTRTEFHRRQGVGNGNPGFTMSGDHDGWLTFGNYNIYLWSLSGVETCVVIKADDLKIALDVGYSIPESISCSNVFITHGHIDHCGGLVNHVAKRGLVNLKKARYYVPSYLVDPLQTIMKASLAMAITTEALDNVNILPFGLDDTVELPGNYSMKAFPTVHRIPSQGYILYKTTKKLKPQYVGQPSAAIAELTRKKVDIFDVISTPEIAYTGDTTIDVFQNPPTPDLLRVKLLITEATYLEISAKHDSMQLAQERGHTHLQQISDNAPLFKNVQHILLMHFSVKYSADFVQKFVATNIAPELRDKVSCATIAKEKSS